MAEFTKSENVVKRFFPNHKESKRRTKTGFDNEPKTQIQREFSEALLKILSRKNEPQSE